MSQDFASPIKKAIGGVLGGSITSTAGNRTLRDTAPLGIVLPDGIAPMAVADYRGIHGELRAMLATASLGRRCEVWQRLTSEQKLNVRLVFESEEGYRYWDLGPAIRRDKGGAIIPDGESAHHVQISQRMYEVRVKSYEARLHPGHGGDCQLEMVPLRKNAFGKLELDDAQLSHDYFACNLTFDESDGGFILSLDTHGWERIMHAPAVQPERLFTQIEEDRHRALVDLL